MHEQSQKRWAIVCVSIAAVSAVSIWTGAQEMIALGRETISTAARIGIGLFLLIMSLAMSVVFFWGHRVIQALRSGRTTFEAWRVAPADYDRFRVIDAAFAEMNDYRALAVAPDAGVGVAFSRDGVLIGDHYFALGSTGLQYFYAVAMTRSNPPMLEFRIVTISANRFGFRRFLSVLRVPTAADGFGRAQKVLAHYQAVLRREVIVHPTFWKARIKIGLVSAAVSGTCALLGFLLRGQNEALHDAPTIMLGAGAIFTIAGLLLALAAWSNDRRNRPR